ncbi:general secretion pathway protein D [Desulfobaculum xiamenense]|uniref:General secretion pathway protein D n=1 Tax=Desulfobaculum xiamenense TaxID=995050 RepID=A0A846QNJ0_9BACT|nr:type II secretion system secretin GspD [Desulfobaculum xiamenense]NJB68757.1 general secretion pathway protein D [Desulfobaculum xiamenense]
MDFQDTDIQLLIKFISQLTGTNFIVDRRVKGKVTVYSPSRISTDEAYEVFKSVLEVHGFTIVPQGAVTKIVPMVAARNMSVPTLSAPSGGEGPDDKVVTQIVPLDFASSADLAKTLGPLVSKEGLLTSYGPGNILIINDYHSNIRRILTIIREADRKSMDASIGVFPMVNGNAKDAAEMVTKLLDSRSKIRAKRGDSVPHSVVGAERINTVIFIGGADDLRIVKNLVKSMDEPTPRGKGDIHLVYLENADAESAAKVLQSLVEDTTTVADTKERKVISKDVKVVADKATNSLAISARPDDFSLLEETIRKLDIPRRQVYVEALIMEVSADKGLSFGVNWGIGGSTHIRGTDGFVFGGSNPGGAPGVADTKNNAFNMPSGFSAGLVLFPFKIGDKLFGSVESVISASKVDTGFRILATPQLLTLDNEEAKVDVVDTIPYVEKVTTKSENTDESQTIKYKDVGVKLTVTPQIGKQNSLRLKLHQEVSRVVNKTVKVSESEPLLLAPTTKKREVETTVQVENGQTIVIAGLLARDESRDRNQIPGLGDMPGLGWLFKQRNTSTSDTNLLLFLTPRIIDTVDNARRMYREKRSFMEKVGVSDEGLGLPWIAPATLGAPVFEK